MMINLIFWKNCIDVGVHHNCHVIIFILANMLSCNKIIHNQLYKHAMLFHTPFHQLFLNHNNRLSFFL